MAVVVGQQVQVAVERRAAGRAVVGERAARQRDQELVDPQRQLAAAPTAGRVERPPAVTAGPKVNGSPWLVPTVQLSPLPSHRGEAGGRARLGAPGTAASAA
ncbi:MAG: hypothetical protein U0168_05720 [Nannocystaceae bacterium]